MAGLNARPFFCFPESFPHPGTFLPVLYVVRCPMNLVQRIRVTRKSRANDMRILRPDHKAYAVTGQACEHIDPFFPDRSIRIPVLAHPLHLGDVPQVIALLVIGINIVSHIFAAAAVCRKNDIASANFNHLFHRSSIHYSDPPYILLFQPAETCLHKYNNPAEPSLSI